MLLILFHFAFLNLHFDLPSYPPPRRQIILDPHAVQHPSRYEVHHVRNMFGVMIERGHGGDNMTPELREDEHVPEMDRRERRLARHEDELPLLLDHDVRGALN